MMNKVFIQGRLVADPEQKVTPSGTAVCTIRLACERDFKNKQTGEKETDFVTCVLWRETAQFVANNFSRGRLIIVVGRLQVRDYTDKDGNKRQAVEVVGENVYFSDSKPSNGVSGGQAINYTPATQKPAYASNYDQQGQFEELGEDAGLPF